MLFEILDSLISPRLAIVDIFGLVLVLPVYHAEKFSLGNYWIVELFSLLWIFSSY